MMKKINTFVLIVFTMVTFCDKKNPTKSEPILSSIEITPATVNIKNNQTQQFTCVATWSNQSTEDVTATADWDLSENDIGSIDSEGLFTAHSDNIGTGTITAVYQGKTAESSITVERDIQYSTMTGNDGTVYQTIKIGNQWWMAENLKETQYRNGDAIPEETNNSTWVSLLTGARCTYNNNANNEKDTYGYLYNWYAVDDSRNIAPEGWHVPTDDEWQTLVDYLGDNAGSKLAGRADIWIDGALLNNAAFDESGYSALPGGYRNSSNGYFYSLGSSAYFWSDTEYDSSDAWSRRLHYDSSGVYHYNSFKRRGFSLRLIRD